MPPPATAEQFLELIGKSGLLAQPRLDQYVERWRTSGARPSTPEQMADALVRDGLLTRFQADQLLCGRYRHFILSGKYKVLRPLGAGGMGQVFLCEHLVMGRRVAVKLLPAGRSATPGAVERFHREARAVARLHHPNIVLAHDADCDADRHFLVMEYIDGPTLHQLVKEHGPLPFPVAADYIRQAALGLHHAHEHGLIHRDVKPSNLLVDRTGTVKVLDLGLARFFLDDADDLSHAEGSPLGTADYLAPEQAHDSHSVDARADVYSLGATLYFLLAGHGPFKGGTPQEKILWHQARLPRAIHEIRPDVPAELESALERMMAKAPNQRFQSAAAVAVALAAWSQPANPPLDVSAAVPGPQSGGMTPLDVALTVRGGQVPAGPEGFPPLPAGGPPPTVPTPAAPPRRLRGAVLIALAVVLVLGGAVGFALQRRDRSDRPRGDGRPAATPRLSLLVPAYFYPSGQGLAEWQRLLRAPDPRAVTIIVNPASGPGRAADPNFARVIAQAREKGFTLVGYVSTRYGQRPAEEVCEDIDRWARLYPGISGIFLDEQASAPDRVDHYAALYDYVRNRRGLPLVVSNPGTICAEGYVARPTANVVCLAESNKDLSQFRPPAWAERHPATQFAALLHQVRDANGMKQAVQAMADKRIGLCYITDRGLPNPWDRLPAYWEEELAAVAEVNQRPRSADFGSDKVKR